MQVERREKLEEITTDGSEKEEAIRMKDTDKCK